MWKIYFFGAGRIGKYWLQCLKEFGAIPEGFVDNNQSLWGRECEGIPIYAPDRLQTIAFDYVAVTCKDAEPIYQQLLEMGIEEEKILAQYHKFRNYLFYYAIKNYMPKGYMTDKNKVNSRPKVLFDLQNGMVLGGVETWSYELAKQLNEKGIGGAYLTTDSVPANCGDITYPAHRFRYRECREEKEKLEMAIRVIAENLPCTVICNFPQYIFWSACIAKKRYPEQVRIIAVQHSDDKTYYEAYGLWQESIDQCLVISSLIEDTLVAYGMSRNKMKRIGWQVSCDKILSRLWSGEEYPIQIGYAGRVTVTLKRVDLLLKIALKLKEKGIRFCLNIAGTGDYAETLNRCIQDEDLGDYINMTGYVDRNKIPAFWLGQDIMISCSEREGHSISQSEAMASGAVPIITDVSGARDDVIDGCNGFVVPVGDLDTLVNRICELYHERDVLEQMGKNAHKTIYERQKEMNQAAFWDSLLTEVWAY